MNKIEKQVLEKITPTENYHKKICKIVEEIKIILEIEIEKKKLPATVELVGSIAKDTYLQNNMDIDFFLCFPINYSKEEIAKNALTIGKSFLTDTEESYAEHPYLRGYYKKCYVEIVPCYKIEKASQKLSAVDRTPLHTKYVKENIKEKQKGEVRLLKQFLKGINCYGAEAQIQGFSGYLCEIIILKYGSFEKTLKSAIKWKYGEKLALKKGSYPDFDTPLVFIDPVDSDRNVSSALIKEKFDFFIKASKAYLKKPKITFFYPNKVKAIDLEKIRKIIEDQDCKYIGIRFQKPKIIDENLYPQIKKSVKTVWEHLKRAEFKIFDVNYYANDKNIYIIIKTSKEKLPDTMIHIGPPVKKESNSKEFLEKWKGHKDLIKGPFKENNRWKVEIKRKHKNISNFLKAEFNKLSLGKHIVKKVDINFSILKKDELICENLQEFWSEYLDKKLPWER